MKPVIVSDIDFISKDIRLDEIRLRSKMIISAFIIDTRKFKFFNIDATLPINISLSEVFD